MWENRVKDASNLFMAEGLAPKVLARSEGGAGGEQPGFTIEEYGGPTFSTSEEEVIIALDKAAQFDDTTFKAADKFCTDFGDIIGRVSKLPTQWYESHRAALKERFPVLQHATNKFFLWPFAKQEKLFPAFMDTITEDQIRRLESAFPAPSNPTLSKIATIHGDLFTDNITRPKPEADLLCIDLEWAAVSIAALELYHGQSTYPDDWVALQGELTNRGLHQQHFQRLFCKAYLEQVGAPAAEADLDAMVFDGDWIMAFFHAPFITNHILGGRDYKVGETVILPAGPNPEFAIAYCEAVAEEVQHAKDKLPKRTEWGDIEVCRDRLIQRVVQKLGS